MNNPNILNAASTNSPSVNSFTSSGFNLNIAMDDDNSTKIVYFDTSPGSLYRIETSTNLIDWLRSRHL